MKAVGLIDYGSGNFRSVRNALQRLDADLVEVRRPADLDRCERLVLPGVGAFATCTRRLEELDLVGPVVAATNAGRPFLGICVGMQVLATTGEEFGEHPGLDLIPGVVRSIDTTSDPAARLPHIGWNACTVARPCPLTDGFDRDPDFYFVHSFHLDAAAPDDVVATCTHGESVTAIVARDHVMGVQFHPEKSQHDGLQVLQAFLDLPC